MIVGRVKSFVALRMRPHFPAGYQIGGLPWWLIGKEFACGAGGVGSIPGLGRPPGEGNGYAFQNSCQENPMDREAWRAAVHRVTNRHNWATEHTHASDRGCSQRLRHRSLPCDPLTALSQHGTLLFKASRRISDFSLRQSLTQCNVTQK